MPISDDTLLAYLDGQLASDTAYREVEAALQASARLRDRLQRLVDSGEQARAAFDIKLHEPVPARLIEAVWNAPWSGRAGNSRLAQAVVASPGRQPIRSGGWWSAWGRHHTGWLAGAAMASVVWAATGLLQVPGPHKDPGQTAAAPPWIPAGSPLEDELLLAALEGIPSGQSVTVRGRSVSVAGSFQRQDGSFCRELEERRLQDGQTLAIRGLACRSRDGDWQVAVQHSDKLPTRDAYGTASDAAHQAIDDFLAGQPAMVVLSQAQELRKIQDGWKH